ncbi:MAG: ABC transporter substrate-binding protein [Ideonella sp. MAG2]|nr:MAG: ABC transporter substrate-binding protein [Ideonella sp. MAG2]
MPLPHHLSSRYLAAVALATLVQPSLADAPFPVHPIKLIVPFAPGGATDTLGRILGAALSEKLGQAVVVENKPGASTLLAVNQLIRAPADGYTLMLGAGTTTLTLNPALRQNLPYDPIKSFTPLGQIADLALVLVVRADFPGETLADLIKLAKAEPGGLSYATFGAGSSVHFAGEMLKSAAGIQMVHVPYNGSGPSLNALMAGQVQLAFDSVVAAAPLIQAGKLKALAVLSDKRLMTLPKVPTVAESGYPGFKMDTWFALLAPHGLPGNVQTKLEKALSEVVQSPEVARKLRELHLNARFGDGASVIGRVERELPHMRALTRRANIQGE